MGFDAKILADSISPDGVRLTTFEVTFPRIVLAEFNTHRMFSRNSASSRAIPVKKLIERVQGDPYIPTSWGKNQKGMQAGEDVPLSEQAFSRDVWLHARDNAVNDALLLLDSGIHKQITNRLLEPFMWHTVIVTATDWANFFHLRNNEMAHPDIQIPARMMQELYESQEPTFVDHDNWHLPLWGFEGDDAWWADAPKISVGRCARVSYLTHDGKRDPAADIDLHNRLLTSGHMSPFEHVAKPMGPGGIAIHPGALYSGNFRGWVQYRKTIPGEADMLNPERQR